MAERGDRPSYREIVLQNTTPTEHLVDLVQRAKKIYQDAYEEGRSNKQWTEYDLALTLWGEVSSNIVTKEEVINSLPALGFDEEGATRFLEETTPVMERLTKYMPSINVGFTYRAGDIENI